MVAAARAHAALAGRAAVGCDDLAGVAPWVLAHRLVPTFQALGKGTTPAALVATLLKQVTPRGERVRRAAYGVRRFSYVSR